MFREALVGTIIGLTGLACYVAGRYNRQEQCPLPQIGRTYQVLPPAVEPAVNLISCDKSSLHNSLEHLRVCRARFKSEAVK